MKAVLAVLLCVGCAGAHSVSIDREEVGTITTSVIVDEPTPAEDVCEAHAFRKCTRKTVDGSGIVHCDAQIQFCRADLSGWLPCGEPEESLDQ